MRRRVVSVVVLATLGGAGVVYTAAASGRARVATCSLVRVSGGNYNGLTGGTIVAAVKVRNLSKRACTVSGRPWIRLGPLRHPVTIVDAVPGTFGFSNLRSRVLTLRPEQQAAAQLFTATGMCDRGPRTTFALEVRAGWANRSVRINNVVCDRTAEISVGPFQR